MSCINVIIYDFCLIICYMKKNVFTVVNCSIFKGGIKYSENSAPANNTQFIVLRFNSVKTSQLASI